MTDNRPIDAYVITDEAELNAIKQMRKMRFAGEAMSPAVRDDFNMETIASPKKHRLAASGSRKSLPTKQKNPVKHIVIGLGGALGSELGGTAGAGIGSGLASWIFDMLQENENRGEDNDFAE